MRFRWTVGKKLAAGFGVALLLLLIVGGVAYYNLIMLVDNAWWVTHTHEVLEKLEGLFSSLKDAERADRGFLLTRDSRLLQPWQEAHTLIPERLQELKDLTRDNATQKENLKRLSSLVTQRLKSIENLVELRKKDPESKDAAVLLDLKTAKGLDEALKVILAPETQHSMDAIHDVIADMEKEEKRLLDERRKREAESITYTKATIIVGSLIALVALSVIGFVLTRGITRPLGEVMTRAQQIAGGNLRQEPLRVATADEIGQLAEAFNTMQGGLQQLARQSINVTANLNAAASEILAAIQEQAAGSRQQAATIQQITTTMEEINQSGAQISQKAKQVATAAEATSVASSSGIQAVQDAARTMELIRAQVEEVAENVVALSEKTQAVGEIIATVNDVAERSNLLALNAAIEAAAAGEQGSRFSVVANEMKNLADQAKDSTVQVRTILGDIQKGINSSVMLTEEAVKRVETGKQQADVTERTIRQMAKTTIDSVQAFEQIAGAGNQQQIGFEQVAQGMKDIRQAVSQTAVATNQLEKAVANLNALGQDLKQAVGRYEL
jgi:methyl-accepting chemotaxis protein